MTPATATRGRCVDKRSASFNPASAFQKLPGFSAIFSSMPRHPSEPKRSTTGGQ